MTTAVHGYTEIARVKNRLTSGPNPMTTNAADDAVIETLIEQASRLIDGQCGRRFWVNSADETRYYSSRDGNCVFVDDLVSITASSFKLDWDGDRTYEITLATTDYDLLPENAALLGEPYTWIETSPNGVHEFPTHRKGVQITGKFGWPAVPDDVKGACEEIVAGAYRRRSGINTSGIATVTGAGVVITPEDIPDTARRVIRHYARLV